MLQFQDAVSKELLWGVLDLAKTISKLVCVCVLCRFNASHAGWGLEQNLAAESTVGQYLLQNILSIGALMV